MKRWISLWIVILLALSGVSGAGAVEPVKIGLLAPLTGFAAADGLSVQNSVTLAMERVLKDGGILGRPVQLVVYDDRADAKDSVALSRKLIQQDRVVAVVGGSYSTPTRAAASIFNDAEVPLVAAYAVHPDITAAGKYCFRNGFLGMVEGKSAGHVAVEMLNAKRIALLTSDNDFGRTLTEGFKAFLSKRGGDAEIVFEQTYPFQEKDFKPYLSKIKEINPDLIFASGYYFQTGPIVKQAREMGIVAKILGEEGADSPKFLEIAGEAAEGFVIVTNLDRDDPRPVVQNFIEAYRKRYDMEPDMVGASAYDAFMIIVDAINRAGATEGPAVQRAIADTRQYNGLTGVVQGFNEIGEVVKEVQVQIVKDGAFRHFGVVKDMELITP